MKSYRLKLTALTPIHIGTGDSYEPTNFVIDDGYLYEFDELLFYKTLSEIEKKALNNRMSNWMDIIDFYKDHKDKAKQLSVFSCEVTQKVEKKYNTLFNKDGSKNKNQFEIHKTYKNPNTYRALIPGSSIKGMLDTVLKIYCCPEVASNHKRGQLIVSDALLYEGGIEIGFSYRKHKNPSKKNKNRIPQIVEIIKPGSVFVLTIKSKMDFAEIQKKFYQYLNLRPREDYLTIANSKNSKNKNGFLARIGKYIGKAYIVYDSKDIKNSYGKPITTHTLYEKGDAPFGWVFFEPIEDEIYEEMLKDIKARQDKSLLERQKREMEIKSKIEEQNRIIKEQMLNKKRERERIEREKRAKEEAMLASLSPVEKLIYQLEKEKTDPNETKDITIFNAIREGRFDSITNGRCEALRILKDEMIRVKKWVESSAKPKKDRKYKRTQIVISLLNECNKIKD